MVHLIAKNEDNLEEALIQGVMAGGDNAARCMFVGMILGAHLGQESIPEKWVSELVKREEIEALLEQIP